MNVSFIGNSLIYVSTFILVVFIVAFCLEMWDFLNSRKSHNFKDIMNIAILWSRYINIKKLTLFMEWFFIDFYTVIEYNIYINKKWDLQLSRLSSHFINIISYFCNKVNIYFLEMRLFFRNWITVLKIIILFFI